MSATSQEYPVEADRDRSRAPLVSVLMPVYDASRYLAQALESILAQTFADFEFLALDDGSTDGSAAILEDYARRDPRLRVLRRPHGGLVARLAEGLAEARGEFIARMDADDVSHPERFARQVDYLLRHPECSAVGGEVLLIDPEGRPICRCGVAPDHETIDAGMMNGNGMAIVHGAALFRRAAMLDAGGYREEYEVAEDVDLFLRLAERGRLANLPDTLLEYRQHPGKLCDERAGALRRARNAILRQVHRRRGLDSNLDLPPPLAERVPEVESWRSWVRGAIEGGHLATARRYAWLGFRAKPFSWRSWQLLVRALLGLRVGPWKRFRAGEV